MNKLVRKISSTIHWSLFFAPIMRISCRSIVYLTEAHLRGNTSIHHLGGQGLGPASTRLNNFSAPQPFPGILNLCYIQPVRSRSKKQFTLSQIRKKQRCLI